MSRFFDKKEQYLKQSMYAAENFKLCRVIMEQDERRNIVLFQIFMVNRRV